MKSQEANVPIHRRTGALIDQLNEGTQTSHMHIFERQEDTKTFILYYNVLQLHTLDSGELVSIEDIKLQRLYHMVINEPGWIYRKEEGRRPHGRHTEA